MSVRIYEVGPRDGLQNEEKILAASVKVELIDRLSETGLTHIEAGAFVSPKWVPQMANTAAVMEQIKRKPGVTYPVLVPNVQGMEAAIAAGVREIAVFAAASESFSLKNINCRIDESLQRFAPVMEMARDHKILVRGYVSCVVGCPYEGYIAPAAVVEVAEKLLKIGCYEISLGDTIGVGTPEKIRAMLTTVRAHIPAGNLALHCHDTYGYALDNIHTGIDMGISVIDSSVAGLGGCPYAPGASGNVSTEAVLGMLQKLGVKTGVDLDKVTEIGKFISFQLRPSFK